MNLKPIITDEQLRDFRDGILPPSERRLVATQIKVDETVSTRFIDIKTEITALSFAAPSVDFSTKIMAQLAAENLVQAPVRQRKQLMVIKSFFIALSILFIGALVVLLKVSIGLKFSLPNPNLYLDWEKTINSRAFLWSVWIGCLLPAVLLVYRHFNRPSGAVFFL